MPKSLLDIKEGEPCPLEDDPAATMRALAAVIKLAAGPGYNVTILITPTEEGGEAHYISSEESDMVTAWISANKTIIDKKMKGLKDAER